jgi:predicted outer membrane protein
MRRMLCMLAAGLLLAACRSDGERGEKGEAVPPDRAANARPGAQPGERPGAQPGERAGAQPGAADDGVGRILAATRVLVQAGLDAGKLAEKKASSPEVKDYATRSVAEYQANLDALNDLTKAKRLDLDAPAVQNDPLLKAEKDAARDGVDRLRTLSGQAFDAAYMTAQRPAQGVVEQLATEGQQASRDAEIGNVLRTTSQQARDRASKALSILPKACGGERPGWGGAG